MTTPRRRAFASAFFAGTALAALIAMSPASAQDTVPPVATVNGVAISAADIAQIAEDLGPTLPQMSPEQRTEYLTSFAIDLKLVAEAAKKENFGDEAEIAKKLAYFRDKIVMEQYLGKLAKTAVTDEAMKKLYDDTVSKAKPQDEVRARHILVPTEEEAKKAYDRVKGGEDFAKVAKELSKDPGSSDGGDLGYFTQDRMVPEFANAAFALKPGEISQPVKSQFGWHIIKVEDRRTRPVPAFEQVKDQIAEYLVRKSQQDLILKLRADAKIERLQPPAEAAPQPAAPAPAPAEAPKQ